MIYFSQTNIDENGKHTSVEKASSLGPPDEESADSLAFVCVYSSHCVDIHTIAAHKHENAKVTRLTKKRFRDRVDAKQSE